MLSILKKENRSQNLDGLIDIATVRAIWEMENNPSIIIKDYMKYIESKGRYDYIDRIAEAVDYMIRYIIENIYDVIKSNNKNNDSSYLRKIISNSNNECPSLICYNREVLSNIKRILFEGIMKKGYEYLYDYPTKDITIELYKYSIEGLRKAFE